MIWIKFYLYRYIKKNEKPEPHKRDGENYDSVIVKIKVNDKKMTRLGAVNDEDGKLINTKISSKERRLPKIE